MACYSVDRRVENSLGRHVRPNKVRILGVDAIENFLGYRQNGFPPRIEQTSFAAGGKRRQEARKGEHEEVCS